MAGRTASSQKPTLEPKKVNPSFVELLTSTLLMVESTMECIAVAESAPIFLGLDGHTGYPVHNSKLVKENVASTNGHLRLFILPPYSPHLNPDE